MTGHDWVYALQKPAKFDVAGGLTVELPLPDIESNEPPLQICGDGLYLHPRRSVSFHLGATDALSLLAFLEHHKEELTRLAFLEDERRRTVVSNAIAELEASL